MPLYDFQCIECATVTERLTASDVLFTLCPTCGHTQERQLSAPGGLKVNGRMVLSQKQMRMIKEPVWQDERDGSITSAF